MKPKAWLFLVLGLFVAYYALTWARSLGQHPPDGGDGDDPHAARGAASFAMLVAGVIAGAICGWIMGGGVQIIDNHLRVFGPFMMPPEAGGDFSGMLTMAVAVIAMMIVGGSVAYLLAKGRGGWPRPIEYFIGFITNFFDTLGIGSYAPTTAMWKAWKIVDDRLIPGTLTVGHTPPTIAEALIFIAIVEVDFTTLALLLAASVLGAWLGAGVVATWSKKNVQLGMGITLFIMAGLFVLKNLDEMRGTPMIPGGTAMALAGLPLVVGFIGNFVLGALMTIGVGLYAPCLIMISLLGMNPTAAFPIMMGSCAFLMPIASGRFIRKRCYSLRPALALSTAGVPAVLIAAFIVKSMTLTTIRWLVVIVVLYTSISMLRSYRASIAAAQPA
ncbi:MAG TPA: sulfite exporter TauE/SafE family protein [Gemmatimonadaceae bacterium]|nr:sulfite exporter TauE/SafE family protein [Gemmatimonadaceae bacterium]